MNTARLDMGAYVELKPGVTVTESLEDQLCRVVGVDGDLRDIRRVGQRTGEPEGVAVRFLAAELRPARPEVLRWHEALRVRETVAEWRRAAAVDEEDFGIVESLVQGAERLAALVVDPHPVELGEVAVCGYVSDRDGAHVVEIDTTESLGRVRVLINDGTIYDGDPDTDEPPGAQYGAGWAVGVQQDENEVCDECGAVTDELVSAQHSPACSLYPDE